MAFSLLVVDDSSTVRDVIKKSLTIADLEISALHEAANGEEALAVLQDSWVDLVFTDLNMPVMNGYEMIDRMQQDEVLRTVPVVVISVEGSTRRIEELETKGIKSFLRKPLTPERIATVVLDALVPQTADTADLSVDEILGQVLEQFAFMFSEAVAKEEMEPPSGPGLRADISFAGPFAGALAIAAPREVCSEIAANVLGIEPDDELARQDAGDALKELLNLTCGYVLTAMAGERSVFDCSVPVTSELDTDAWRAFAAEEATIALRADDHPVLLRLELEDQSQ